MDDGLEIVERHKSKSFLPFFFLSPFFLFFSSFFFEAGWL